ncbi:hypothetical protein PMZ80_005868 [Knufia obscura]|uniref:Uncharacterized protein n=1 Tax=Knufia obscura TaxID=1635080 RepID=A0ABR0RNE0_9EURO|nr:hypothetical protein PMZ80_005868 [Knufia obscura]
MEFNLNELKRKRYVPAKNTVFGDAIFLVLSALRDGKYHHIETTPKFPVSVDEFLMNGRTDFVIGRDFGRTFKAMDADTSDPSLSVRWFDASGKQHDQSVSGKLPVEVHIGIPYDHLLHAASKGNNAVRLEENGAIIVDYVRAEKSMLLANTRYPYQISGPNYIADLLASLCPQASSSTTDSSQSAPTESNPNHDPADKITDVAKQGSFVEPTEHRQQSQREGSTSIGDDRSLKKLPEATDRGVQLTEKAVEPVTTHSPASESEVTNGATSHAHLPNNSTEAGDNEAHLSTAKPAASKRNVLGSSSDSTLNTLDTAPTQPPKKKARPDKKEGAARVIKARPTTVHGRDRHDRNRYRDGLGDLEGDEENDTEEMSLTQHKHERRSRRKT